MRVVLRNEVPKFARHIQASEAANPEAMQRPEAQLGMELFDEYEAEHCAARTNRPSLTGWRAVLDVRIAPVKRP
jgi:hypothetical protein